MNGLYCWRCAYREDKRVAALTIQKGTAYCSACVTRMRLADAHGSSTQVRLMIGFFAMIAVVLLPLVLVSL